MADLNHGDIQRAVQDGMRGVQNDLQRVSNQLLTLSQQLNHLDEILITVRELQRSAQSLQHTLANMKGASGQAYDPRISQVAAEVHDLRTRFGVIERFAVQMSDYVQSKYEEDQEDRQYREA